VKVGRCKKRRTGEGFLKPVALFGKEGYDNSVGPGRKGSSNAGETIDDDQGNLGVSKSDSKNTAAREGGVKEQFWKGERKKTLDLKHGSS